MPIQDPLIEMQKKKKKTTLTRAEKEKQKLEELEEKKKLVPVEIAPCFFCKSESIRLKKNSSFNLPLIFIP